MCQLLGMNCNTPTDIMFSFEGFRRRGGITDHHADGFGIGFFEGKGVRLFHDDKPSANSPSPTSCVPTKSNRKTSSHISAKHRKDKPRWRTPIPLCAKCGAATGCLPTTDI